VPQPPQRPPARRRGPISAFPGRLAIALALVVTIVVGGFVLVNVLVEQKLASAQRVDLTLADPPDGGGANYLLIGSDTRAFVKNAGQQQAFGTESDAGGKRSDTIMVLHTDPDSGRALLVSFPRDLWVDVPGRGKTKINAAFNEGPQSVVDTITNNFNVPIHHYAEVNFESFREIVDAIGTIPVFFPTAARDELSQLHIPYPGCAQLDGATALAYVRSRHLQLLNQNTGKWVDADEIPDLGRIGRQQAFLRELGARAMDAALGNPFTGDEIAQSTVDHLTIDQKFGRNDVFALAEGLAGGTGGTGGPESQTVPTEPARHDNQDVLEPTKDAEALMARLRDFTTPIPDPSAASAGDTRVRVLNASGETGAAGAALGGLKKAGFEGRGTGNADKLLKSSEVHYPSGNQDAAALVATYVLGPVDVVRDDSVDGADVVLHVGREFGGIITDVATGAPAFSLAPVPGAC
jgi:LCP family protein required for cell wall assembly